MVIVAVTTKSGKNYTVGHSPVHLDDALVVDKILFHRSGNLYNKGFEVEGPCYSVAMVDSDVRRLVPMHEASEVCVDTKSFRKKKKDDDEAPEDMAFLTETPDDQEEVDEAQ
jgi:hypothetical protein